MMTKKHFEFFAELVADVKFSEEKYYLENKLINFFIEENPRFDEKRFRDAVWKREEENQELYSDRLFKPLEEQ